MLWWFYGVPAAVQTVLCVLAHQAFTVTHNLWLVLPPLVLASIVTWWLVMDFHIFWPHEPKRTKVARQWVT
ncbi:hypothetical protein COT78_01740 [Candidatus Berkelbacteria bacterium CG10_big_fil_rev_8_21_14_0_10_43_13]|uniref:Uncharacterized protein n=1 Tax=Candidatus Berkelbacteria bacterium CG10_big_fil_rev_8_21_14_0_10_43_13 TaxID=1974514 RepID=A0A2H0W714_9BACT|nr:MAG: hypothetical protein COT78_01740 [Candidatus Berkelbacteria bacterium CG10_big_fil_rev_8_21_14_0_10_43_13]